MRCQPPGSGAAIDAWHFRYLNVDTSYLGTARGKRALYFTFDLSGGTSVNQLILDHFRGGNAGGGYSVEILSDDAINAAGVPFGLQVYGVAAPRVATTKVIKNELIDRRAAG
jgi:hypothetical protein